MLPFSIREFDREADMGFILGTYGACTSHAPGVTNRWWARIAAQCLALRIADDSRWRLYVAQFKTGSLIGWIAVRDEDPKKRLFFCYVKHAFRKEGVATELVRVACGAAGIVHCPMPLGPAGRQWLRRIGSYEEESKIP